MAPKELVLKKGKDLVVDSPFIELDIVDQQASFFFTYHHDFVFQLITETSIRNRNNPFYPKEHKEGTVCLGNAANSKTVEI